VQIDVSEHLSSKFRFNIEWFNKSEFELVVAILELWSRL